MKPTLPIFRSLGYQLAASEAPVVSIVTPYFNTGAIFSETVLSVLAQSLQSWEWIIVDDGSAANLRPGSLQQLPSDDSRIRIISHKTNLGLSAARNTGIKYARADLIALLDSDDIIAPTFLEKCVWKLLTQAGVGFTKGYSKGFDAESYLWKNGFHDGKKFLEENRVDPTAVLRKAILQEIGGFDESIRGGLEDWDLWLNAASHGYWGETITEPLNSYRRRPEHWKKWSNISKRQERDRLGRDVRSRYKNLWTGPFPHCPARSLSTETITTELPTFNKLRKSGRRLLCLLPHLELGGADRFNLDLIDQLKRRFGWDVTVVTTRVASDVWSEEFYSLTSDVFMLHRFLDVQDYPKFLYYLNQSRGFDAIFLSHSILGYEMLPWLRCKFPGVAILDYVHIVMEDWKGGGYPNFSARYSVWLDRTIASSHMVADWMVRHSHTLEKISVTYTNIDPAFWKNSPELRAAEREALKISDSEVVLIFAGRFSDQKRPKSLLPIVQGLVRRQLRFKLLLAGEGPDADWIENNLVRPYRNNVFSFGSVSPREVRRLMSAADILVLPSKSEGIALILFEAMSMNVVPVVTAVGGQHELIAEDFGVLIPNDENIEVAFVEVIERLARNPLQLRKMAAHARLKIERDHSLDSMGSAMHSHLLDIVGLRRPPQTSVEDVDRELIAAIKNADEERKHSDLWMRTLQSGGSFPGFITHISAVLRKTPILGRWFKSLEKKYGERAGVWILRYISRTLN